VTILAESIKQKRLFSRTKREENARPRKERGPVGRFFSRLSENRVLGSDYFLTPFLALLLFLLIEGFGYLSPFGGFQFIYQHPGSFLVNYAILFASLSIAWPFRKRIFIYTAVFFIWSLIGIINGIVLSFRMTPFTTADLQILDMGIDMFNVYFNQMQKVFAYGGLGLGFLAFILLFFLAPKRRIKERLKPSKQFRNRMIAFVVSCACVVGAWNLSIGTGMVSSYFINLWDAYKYYGVPYGFLSTWMRTGIKKPPGYSEQKIDAIFSKGELDSMTADKPDVNVNDFPNILFLQLESFIDPDEIKGLTLSGNPIPYYKKLMRKYSSGHLRVPVVGGGTANTEFEAMTGMSVRNFGPGEYPYKTVLLKQSCESLAYDLKELGYTSHAIHNHRGSFYNRNKVFRNLGFDDFTSVEYMNYVSKTPKNFATDDVLTGEIMGALEATAGRDYIYAISVQGHGEYPKTKMIKKPKFTVTSPMSQEHKYEWEYYLEEISDMDTFLKVLIGELNAFDEPIALVLFGDHLPGIGLSDEDMKTGTMFNTQYVIWSNFDMPKVDKDLSAYQLGGEIESRLGIRQGLMPVFHQEKQSSPHYQDYLHLLMYDIFYGNRYIYGGSDPFPPADMKMGHKPIRINEVVEMGGEYYISGDGFTPFSKITLDGKILRTVFVGPTTLKLIDNVNITDVSRMKVSQIEKKKTILSTTE